MKQEENVCAKCACFRAEGLRCKNQPLGITHPETELCSRFEEKCCGNCCWFCMENADGWGQCCTGNAMEGWEAGLDPIFGRISKCDYKAGNCSKYVSRQQMRHHMAVLLQWERYMSDRSELTLYRAPSLADRNKAMKFAYKYMKVFSKL